MASVLNPPPDINYNSQTDHIFLAPFFLFQILHFSFSPFQLLSLTEKYQVKEQAAGEPVSCQKPDPIPAGTDTPCLQVTVKVEDRLSIGSDTSAVMDDDGPQLLDSGNSYFPNDENITRGCIATVVGINLEEDDGSDDGGSYFSDVFAVGEQQEPIGWFIWS